MSSLVFSKRDPLFGLSAEDFEKRLREALLGKVECAYFFGSFARRDYGPNSDVDLIIVHPTDKPFLARAEEFYFLMDINPALDLLIYTPEEFHQLKHQGGFWKSVGEEMRQIV